MTAPSALDCHRVEDNAIHLMKFIEIPVSDFDLAMTLDSGQVFHWEKAGDGFVGTIGDCPVDIEQRRNILKVNTEGGAPATLSGQRAKSPRSREFAPPVAGMVRHYFALDHP